jgi:beta-lactamase class A
VPDEERERIEEGLEEARKTVEEYGTVHDGTAGVYVQDLRGGWGYGVNPDETFFSASVIKIPVMVAVYRAIDEGKFSLQDEFPTAPEDWAAGAGTLQFQEAGGYHTVKEYLRVMMTQSDNVATNALTRLVGGPDYVNAVAASLGAPDTVLYQKVTSERAAVPLLDNRTTPRDMSTILKSIYAGQAANPESCQEMVDLMHQNNLQSSLKEGLPEGTKVANKGGWLFKVYDEAGIVAREDNPYAIAIFSKNGSADVEEGKALLRGISKGVWQAQGG